VLVVRFTVVVGSWRELYSCLNYCVSSEFYCFSGKLQGIVQLFNLLFCSEVYCCSWKLQRIVQLFFNCVVVMFTLVVGRCRELYSSLIYCVSSEFDSCSGKLEGIVQLFELLGE
jgi:hypothetical protein